MNKSLTSLFSKFYLPEHDGFWIAEHLPCSQLIPIIFITAHDRPVYRLCAPIVGAQDYIAKPFDPNVLLLRIEKALYPAAKSSSRFLEAIGGEPSHGLEFPQKPPFDIQ